MQLEANLKKEYRDFKCSIKFSIENDRFGIFGPSGSGKSTLMNMLAGLTQPDFGRIVLNGKTIFDSDMKINLAPDKRKIGVVFQSAHLFPHMSVTKNLLYGRKKIPVNKRNIDPEQLISALKLNSLMKRNVKQLSGGEKQRVALGRTILSEPELILLDEPLTGLDDELKFQIIPHLRRVFSEFSIPSIFISHSLQEMRMMTEKVLVMANGMIKEKMSTEDLARTTLGTGGRGYINLLDLEPSKDLGDLYSYKWGNLELILIKKEKTTGGQFSIGSRDILLFKKHPEATSARNMLACTVRSTYETEWLSAVELDCEGQTLIAEVVPQSIAEMNVKPGTELMAVMKASSFQRLY
ncbi:MAG: molybdenum ABC transporter ATP-binding protein [Desulfotalea sp.]